MNIKSAASVLLAGAILWLIVDIYWLIERFSGGAWEYYKKRPLKLVISSFSVFVPVTVIIFAAAIMNNRSNNRWNS